MYRDLYIVKTFCIIRNLMNRIIVSITTFKCHHESGLITLVVIIVHYKVYKKIAIGHIRNS